MNSQKSRLNVPVILLTDEDYYQPERIKRGLAEIRELGELRMVSRLNEEDLIASLKGVDVAVVRRDWMTRRVFASSPDLLGIIKMGAGYERIDIQAATEQRVVVANSPGVTIGVAEAAMLLMLSLSRPYSELLEIAKAGGVPPSDLRGFELHTKTLGIIGFGQIGSYLAKIASGFGMRVLVYDHKPYKVQGFEAVSFASLLRHSDFVSLHCPLTLQTRYLIDAQALQMMQPHACLINTARGAIVDTAALVKALQVGWISGAGLDVLENEPVPADHPLLSMSNVIVTPHALGRTWEALDRVFNMIHEGLQAILQGIKPQRTLNPKVVMKHSRYARE